VEKLSTPEILDAGLGDWRKLAQALHARYRSEVACRPPPGSSAYATAKSAQIGLSRSWARELASSGITVNTVAPGFIPIERHADVAAGIRNTYLASVPAGRMGTPSDIAHAVSFLASEGASFITGQRIVVDGGRSLGT
jgi:3-oxoacyl-[acyl-carrier protein] reductase